MTNKVTDMVLKEIEKQTRIGGLLYWETPVIIFSDERFRGEIEQLDPREKTLLIPV